MGEKITVVASDPAKRPVPLERARPGMKPIGAEPVEVDNTLYYRRQIACGDLKQIDAGAAGEKAGG